MEKDSLEYKEYRNKIIKSLKKVIDPDLNINIIDMGFIYRVEITDDIIEVDYTLTTMGCPLADVIEDDIKNNLKKDFERQANLKLVWDPTWRVDFMSVEARIELGYPI